MLRVAVPSAWSAFRVPLRARSAARGAVNGRSTGVSRSVTPATRRMGPIIRVLQLAHEGDEILFVLRVELQLQYKVEELDSVL